MADLCGTVDSVCGEAEGRSAVAFRALIAGVLLGTSALFGTCLRLDQTCYDRW